MKAKQRHELHTNALAEWISETGESLKPYSTAIIVVVSLLAIALAAFFYVQGASQRGAVAASDQLLEGMSMDQGSAGLVATVKDYPGTTQAAMAQLILAEALLDSGTNALFQDKKAGRVNLSKALGAFDEMERGTRDPMLRAWAMYGVARSQESLGDLGQARIAYEQLAREYPESALASAARQHLSRLNQPAAKEFYDWFAMQNPEPPAAENTPGVPGLKPSFDLKEPNSPGDVKLPSALGPSGSKSPPSSTAPSTSLPPAAPAGDTSKPNPPAQSSPQSSAPTDSSKAPKASK